MTLSVLPNRILCVELNPLIYWDIFYELSVYYLLVNLSRAEKCEMSVYNGHLSRSFNNSLYMILNKILYSQANPN